jgi:hypothetical protein
LIAAKEKEMHSDRKPGAHMAIINCLYPGFLLN